MTGTFEGVGSLQFTPDNKHAYAYSGAVTITTGSFTTGLEFTNGSEYILSNFQITSLDSTGSDLYYKIAINGVQIVGQFNYKNSNEYGFSPIEFVIPPFSNVVISAERGSGSDYDVYMTITGKVGGAIEQQNLEAISDNNKWASL